MRTTAYTTVRPRYGFFDVVGLLFRELLLMIVIFLLVFAIGTAAVLTLKKSYTASASVYAGVGQEYVYQPRVGAAERGGQPLEADAVAQSEAQILGSLAVKQKTVDALGADAILGPRASGTPAEKKAAALKALDSGLGVGTTPGSAIISASYAADDPVRAATILNALIDQYLVQRRAVFRDRTTPAIAAQREAFEDELAKADAAYQAFMTSNDIGDFATAKASLARAERWSAAAAGANMAPACRRRWRPATGFSRSDDRPFRRSVSPIGARTSRSMSSIPATRSSSPRQPPPN